MQLRPGQAALLSLAVPGLAHVMLGKPLRALVTALLAFGLFFAGFGIVGDRIWFVGLELGDVFGLIPGNLHFMLPELLNPMPFLMVHTLQDLDSPEALRMVRLPREGEHIGFWLMAASGMISALGAADASWISRRAGRASQATAGAGRDHDPIRLALLTWLVPGAGHLVFGQKSKGLLVGGSIFALFFLGLVLSGGHGVDRAARPIWWMGQSPFGGGTLFAALATAPSHMQEFPGRFFDLGVVLCTVAGLLNVVLICDSYSIAERAQLGLPMPEPRGSQKRAKPEVAASEAPGGGGEA